MSARKTATGPCASSCAGPLLRRQRSRNLPEKHCAISSRTDPLPWRSDVADLASGDSSADWKPEPFSDSWEIPSLRGSLLQHDSAAIAAAGSDYRRRETAKEGTLGSLPAAARNVN